jgi:hypothetical protein
VCSDVGHGMNTSSSAAFDFVVDEDDLSVLALLLVPVFLCVACVGANLVYTDAVSQIPTHAT